MISTINYTDLVFLGDKVKNGDASKTEKDKFMELLYQNGSISKHQYDDYIKGRNTEAIVNAALAVGAIVLLGYFIEKMFSKN
jgi:hypothetical protein